MPLRVHSATRSLNLETLESRYATAALTASLSSTGALLVQGTAGNDQIQINQTSNKITVSGVSGIFDATRIKSITVNTLAGNDAVTFKGFNSSQTSWSKPITVNNSAGSDKVVTITGTTVSLGKGTYARNVSGSQAAPVSGPPPVMAPPPVTTQTTTWFDTNIRDAALRSVLKSDFVDRKLDRNDMLDLFEEIARDRVVSANEYADLRAVANNASLFKTVEYVGALTQEVVLGNVANATYQGTTLGNLKAGASATHLEKLVNKWFLGLDRPNATFGGTTYAYARASGSLFGASPSYDDVRQGELGDCYLLAALGETALRSQASIRDMFIVNGDGTYTVRFFNDGRAEYVTVDSKLPVDGSGRFVFANAGQFASSSANVLWVALAEKAYAQMNQSGWLRTGMTGSGQNSYQAIAVGYFYQAVEQVTNRTSTSAAVAGSSFSTFKTAFDAGKLIALASQSKPDASNIVAGHQYIVVGYNATAQTVTLFNPWGLNNGTSSPGLVTMSWSSLAASFSYWDRA